VLSAAAAGETAQRAAIAAKPKRSPVELAFAAAFPKARALPQKTRFKISVRGLHQDINQFPVAKEKKSGCGMSQVCQEPGWHTYRG
jgi:hypothetical protein